MDKKTINYMIPTELQYDIALQEGCYDDCASHFGNSNYERGVLTNLGINVIDPTQEDIQIGVMIAELVGLSYCYLMYTPVTNIYF